MIKALLIAAVAAAAVPSMTDVQELVQTERNFSAAAAQIGVPAAFRRYAAPGGVVFQDKPVPVAVGYPGNDKELKLAWTPSFAGAAASGEIGYDIGPWTITDGKGDLHGWFFTVWGRQANRKWRFLVDNGIVSGPGAGPAPPGEAATAPNGMSGDASNAFGRVEMAELEVGRSNLARSLARDAWVLRTGAEAAQGAAARALVRKDPRIAYTPMGGGASAAGDLAYMYGRAAWKDGTGHYLRVWRRGGSGWQVVVDSLVPVTPAAKG